MVMINNNKNNNNVIPQASFTSGEQFSISQVKMKFEKITKINYKYAKL